MRWYGCEIFSISRKHLKCLLCSSWLMRSFADWWRTVPIELQQKARRGDEKNKPLLDQINYAILNLRSWVKSEDWSVTLQIIWWKKITLQIALIAAFSQLNSCCLDIRIFGHPDNLVVVNSFVSPFSRPQDR